MCITHASLGRYLVPLCFALSLIGAESGRCGELQAGAAKVDITPPLGFPMWGYGARHDMPSKGVLDPLHARAVVLAVGKERLAVISLDLGRAPTRHITASICKRVQKAGVGQIFLVASHTH